MSINESNKIISNEMKSKCLRNEAGFTLVEALIGFLILSIGMLGIASLQAVSLKAGKTSIYGSVAAMKVEELFENIRANPEGMASYTGAGAETDCTGATCTSSQMAANDVFLWKEGLASGLPPTDTTTKVVVTSPVSPSKMATVTVTVGWKERSKDSEASVTKTFSATSNICVENPC